MRTEERGLLFRIRPGYVLRLAKQRCDELKPSLRLGASQCVIDQVGNKRDGADISKVADFVENLEKKKVVNELGRVWSLKPHKTSNE